jgi:4-aminobutyrate aminotransferase-like enzyme
LRSELDALGVRSNALANVRGLGVLAGVDLVTDRSTGEAFAPHARAGEWMVERLRQNQTILRAYGDTLAIGLPLSISRTEVDELISRLSAALEALPPQLRDGALASA